MAKDRKGGRLGKAGREAARRAYEQELATRGTPEEHEAALKRAENRMRKEATEHIASILGDVELDLDDWEIGYAYWSSDGGGGSYNVLSTQIDGVDIMVVIGHGATSAYHGYHGTAYEEYPEHGHQRLSPASFWEAMNQ